MYNDREKSDRMLKDIQQTTRNRLIEQDINLIHRYNIDSLAVALLVCGIRNNSWIGYYTDEVSVLKNYIESVWEYANRKNITYPEALRAISKEAQNISNQEKKRC